MLIDARATRAKSRRGCKTCKIRRVKCGEEKPHCVRCSSTGRKCEYDVSILNLHNPLSLSPNTVWRERRSFASYFQHTAPYIGGGLDVAFWSTVVPQVCRSEPAIWDAIIAVSALFETPEPPAPEFGPLSSWKKGQNHRDALAWYARSVSAVRQRIERGRLDIFVGLISCILFICIEGLQEGVEEAMRLYNQGVCLILTLRAQIAAGVVSATKASLLEDTIVPIFDRLGAIALPIGTRVHTLQRDTIDASRQEFISLKAAREAAVSLAADVQFFEYICIEHLRETGASHVDQELLGQQTTLSARLSSWHTSVTNLLDSLRAKGLLSPQQTGTGALLLAHHEMLYTIVRTCTYPSLTATDAYLLNYQNIVEQSSIALDASARSDGTQPPYTFELNIGVPLWFTCLRCREPQTRRMALALLRRAPRVQGFSQRHSAVDFGERIMVLEERNAMKMNAPLTPLSPLSQSPSSSSSSSRISRFDPTVFLTTPNHEYAPTPHSILSDINNNNNKISAAALIPEEARIGPVSIFRPQDGFPRGTTEQDIAKWKMRGPKQIFLRLSWNEHDVESDTWRTVHEYVPTTF
ncbi:hypothetical protein UA08_01818 [Talaromyces atroroseus]|uniref:Zn(2)-C6 fungal-type domain-containing protein n=1 Tax=Talaromyces atroroseus TaxID=1441469 RepID=A0A1Q5QA82_TALAT|nr:hypothetical protein UA08_01818 [Talaromyces atroroseus]OKL62842.1 hypothetical protein UA08_01818 [Talaromyces atroroseus]